MKSTLTLISVLIEKSSMSNQNIFKIQISCSSTQFIEVRPSFIQQRKDLNKIPQKNLDKCRINYSQIRKLIIKLLKLLLVTYSEMCLARCIKSISKYYSARAQTSTNTALVSNSQHLKCKYLKQINLLVKKILIYN